MANDSHKLLTPEEAADLLGVSVASLPGWRVRGEGPPFVRVGRLVRYRLGDVLAWIETRVRRSTSDCNANA